MSGSESDSSVVEKKRGRRDEKKSRKRAHSPSTEPEGTDTPSTPTADAEAEERERNFNKFLWTAVRGRFGIFLGMCSDCSDRHFRNPKKIVHKNGRSQLNFDLCRRCTEGNMKISSTHYHFFPTANSAYKSLKM
ncbi:hypothetical protein AAVH_38887 [Aphelenchoides avenae]|nr:hypothetical protein AAVH_38887 [Aphelenchus avenae]